MRRGTNKLVKRKRRWGVAGRIKTACRRAPDRMVGSPWLPPDSLEVLGSKSGPLPFIREVGAGGLQRQIYSPSGVCSPLPYRWCLLAPKAWLSLTLPASATPVVRCSRHLKKALLLQHPKDLPNGQKTIFHHRKSISFETNLIWK